MHEIVRIIAQYFIVIPVLIFMLTAYYLPKTQRVRLLLLMLLSIIITTLLIKLATTLHTDPRPFVRDNVTPYFKSATDNGFPSDHTALSACIGFMVLVFRRRVGVALLILALLIGSARVIAGVHHGQDIIGGFVLAGIGVGISQLLLSMAHKRKQATNVTR